MLATSTLREVKSKPLVKRGSSIVFGLKSHTLPRRPTARRWSAGGGGSRPGRRAPGESHGARARTTGSALAVGRRRYFPTRSSGSPSARRRPSWPRSSGADQHALQARRDRVPTGRLVARRLGVRRVVPGRRRPGARRGCASRAAAALPGGRRPDGFTSPRPTRSSKRAGAARRRPGANETGHPRRDDLHVGHDRQSQGLVHPPSTRRSSFEAHNRLVDMWRFRTDDVHLVVGPMYHTLPNAYAAQHLFVGATSVVMPGSMPRSAFGLIAAIA